MITRLFVQQLAQATTKEGIKIFEYWSFVWGISQWLVPLTKASNEESISLSWHHLVFLLCHQLISFLRLGARSLKQPNSPSSHRNPGLAYPECLMVYPMSLPGLHRLIHCYSMSKYCTNWICFLAQWLSFHLELYQLGWSHKMSPGIPGNSSKQENKPMELYLVLTHWSHYFWICKLQILHNKLYLEQSLWNCPQLNDNGPHWC